MKFGKRMAVGSMAVMTATAMSANAQFMPQMAGTGYNMGQQGCGQQVQAGAGARPSPPRRGDGSCEQTRHSPPPAPPAATASR